MGAKAGKLFRHRDHQLEEEITNVYRLLQLKQAGASEVQIRDLAIQVGKVLQDGQLEVLNRVIQGLTECQKILIHRRSQQGDKTPLEITQDTDARMVTATRGTQSGVNSGALFRSDDTLANTSTLQAQQQGSGSALHIVPGIGTAAALKFSGVATGAPYLKLVTTEIHSASGSPEGVVTAAVGSLYLRTDGGAATTLYVKESGSGSTGWVAK